MRTGIFFKYMSSFVAVIFLLVLIISLVSSSLVNNYNKTSKTEILLNASNEIYEIIDEGMTMRDITDLGQYTGLFSKTIRTHMNLIGTVVEDFTCFIVNSNGKIILSGGGVNSQNYGNNEGLFLSKDENYNVGDEILTQLSNNKVNEISGDLNGILGHSSIIYSISVYDGSGNFSGAIISSYDQSEVSDLLSNMNSAMIFSAFAIGLASVVLIYFVSKRQAAPLKSMSMAASKFAKGDFSTRINVTSKDEIGHLAESFNSMAEDLENHENMNRQFLSNVSHDLRTPMTTISGFMDSIMEGAIKPEDYPKYFSVISSEIKRLSRLVTTLLDITRIESGTRKFMMERFDICEMARQIIISSEMRITKKNIDLSFESDRDNMYVHADKDAINQVMYNLIDNAIKFTGQDQKMTVNITRKGEFISTEIYNYGVGISEEDLPHVFDRFYKTDKSRGLDKMGLGLGLYIVKAIIDAHDGEIKAESDGANWTRFTFYIRKDQEQ